MHLSELAQKSILILGFAREGIATLTFLKQNLPEATITIMDTRELGDLPPEAQELIRKHAPSLLLGHGYLTELEHFDVIIKIPSLSYKEPKIQEALHKGVTITSSTNIFYANTTAKIVAITGSKGKSTTSTLIYQCLKKAGKTVALIGNIGEPAISYLGKEQTNQLYVFEMSSYQLEDFQYAPHVGVFVSFFPDHIDHHGDIDSYFEAKSAIGTSMTSEDILIYNAASPRIRSFAQALSCKTIPFNDGSTSCITQEGLWYKEELVVRTTDIQLMGTHNQENILAVIAVAKEFDVATSTIREVVTSFTGLPHRLEEVGTFSGITFYNDAISTTPESTIAAIMSMPEPIGTIILGGLDRGYHFEELSKIVLEKAISHVILLPDSGNSIWETLVRIAQQEGTVLPTHTFVSSMEACVQDAYTHTPKDTICLLSCASPSYSIFKNFEDKGEQFRMYVEAFAPKI